MSQLVSQSERTSSDSRMETGGRRPSSATASRPSDSEQADEENLDESQEGSKRPDPYLVDWDGPDDPTNPLNMKLWRKWVMVFVVSFAAVCTTCDSSMASLTYPGMQADFGVSQEVCILSVSLFVAGLGCGPLLLGPMSEFVGRKWTYYVAFGSFFLLNFPVAFANHISVLLIFRFFTGFAGSAFLSVAGGTVSDIFHNHQVGPPMMIFSSAPFLGPVLGPLLSGFINANVSWRWTYYVVIIWSAVQYALIFIFVPETYAPAILLQKAKRLRADTGNDKYFAESEREKRTVKEAVLASIKTPFVILSTQPMAVIINCWCALILGILYLSFGGFPYMFRTVHGFTTQQVGLSFLGIGFGQMLAIASTPYWTRMYKRTAEEHGGKAPPEARLQMGMVGAICCPLGMFIFAFTSYHSVPWIIPILGSVFFGIGMVLAFTSSFTFLVDAYRPVAASAMASNSFVRSAFAAGFPLFGNQMYERLGVVGASALLAGLLTLVAPFPFLFYRYGARIRARSNMTV